MTMPEQYTEGERKPFKDWNEEALKKKIKGIDCLEYRQKIFGHLEPDMTEYPSFEELKRQRDGGEPLESIVPGLQDFPHEAFMLVHESVEVYRPKRDANSGEVLSVLGQLTSEIQAARSARNLLQYEEALKQLAVIAIWGIHNNQKG